MNLPERWKLVPVEPTKEMIVRGTVWAKYAEESYKAMLAAAPTPPAQECKCDMRTKLVGDGCEVCNPELAAELTAQKNEPVGFVSPGELLNLMQNGPDASDVLRTGLYSRSIGTFNIPLYTRPDDKLRKAAEEVVTACDRHIKHSSISYGLLNAIENLSAALEGKPTPSDTDKQSPE